MDHRPRQASTRPAFPSPLLRLGLSTALLLIAACQAAPTPTAAPSVSLGDRPAVRIDPNWTATNGQWTFTGQVDPQGDPTDVVLEIGPGPATARRFDSQVVVAQAITAAGPLTINTREVPDIPDICVRFSATNAAGVSSSSPLCFPHDPPTPAPVGAPTVQIDERWSVENGQWSFSARIDPKGSPTDVDLEVAPGPAPGGQFVSNLSAAQAMTEAAKLTVSIRDVPDGDEFCVRFKATNALGKATSSPLCVPRDGSSPAPSG